MSEEERITSVYLDACCLNRPFDDQTQTRIRLESEAILLILSSVEAGRLRLIASEALHFEIAQTPDPERGKRVTLLANAADSVAVKMPLTTPPMIMMGITNPGIASLNISNFSRPL